MIANVNVIMETASEEVLFYTFFPYQEFACRSTIPVLTHRFNDNFVHLDGPFFPPKDVNFHGCPLRVLTTNEVILNLANYKKPKALQNYGMSIFEAKMLKEFTSRMNFMPEVYEWAHLKSPDSELPITDGKIDVLLSYIRNSPKKNYLYSKTVPYYFSWMVIAVYPQFNKFRTQAWIVAPFNFTTWSFLIASLSLITSCIILANTRRVKQIFSLIRQSDSQLGGLDVISLVIGGSIEHLPKKIFLRFSLTALSLGTLVIRTAYIGKIYDAFRGQTLLIPPRSLKQLFAENYTILATYYYKYIVDDLSKNIDYPNFKEIIDVTKIFDLLAGDKKEALVTTFITVYTFFPANAIKKLQMESVFGEQNCIFFQMHSFILPKFNDIIVRLEEAGILNYFQKGFNKLNDGDLINIQGNQEPEVLCVESFDVTKDEFLLTGEIGDVEEMVEPLRD
ncbi:uncharacterized protein LOC129911380 [Episyrphus balteatus]|uniref:uncharacterized protein LOC129911380 n=1 Tax=Episyrphus balteatus TaxID=286459 RepID=UPI00248618C0|nr:uncharacterized protein LOC129911380 [Episyrphus balteatus]